MDNLTLLEELNLKVTAKNSTFLIIRGSALVLLTVLLIIHLKTMRIFRWEHSVSGGLIVTYVVADIGLCLATMSDMTYGYVLQAYLSGLGFFLFTTNALIILCRWRFAGEMTMVVAELLVTLGMQVKRQVLCKVIISFGVAALFLTDMVLTPFVLPKDPLRSANVYDDPHNHQ